jgi:hypothetical protein
MVLLKNSKKPNGTPACAGVTVKVEREISKKNNCHARGGGHPIFLVSFFQFFKNSFFSKPLRNKKMLEIKKSLCRN